MTFENFAGVTTRNHQYQRYEGVEGLKSFQAICTTTQDKTTRLIALIFQSSQDFEFAHDNYVLYCIKRRKNGSASFFVILPLLTQLRKNVKE